MGSMTTGDTRRKLTTVFTADVQSYSRLMEADEEGTLRTLKHYRGAMQRLIEAHGGRVINTWGDALFAEFASVVEAVRAAVDIQNELAQRNAGLAAEMRMQFRIGINLGDVIVDGDDIYGDGVNVAARLQAVAPPGGVVISSTVYDHVRNKLPVGFEFLGDLTVKNIDHEVPSYALLIGEGAAKKGRSAARRRSEPQQADSGRGPEEPAPIAPKTGDARFFGQRQALAKFGVIVAALVIINLLTDPRDFWAAWPILAIAVASGYSWSRSLAKPLRRRVRLLILAAGIVGVNALSWQGDFWAVWPLLVFGVLLALDWTRRLGADRP